MKAKVILPVALSVAIILSAGTACFSQGPVEVEEGSRCSVCGMFVHKYPKWWAEVVFRDGSAAFFDGPKCMFEYYFNTRKYTGKKREDMVALWVKDYYTLKWLDAKKAYFVLGSDVLGPMGHELVPVSSPEAAEEFIKDHGGKQKFQFHEITHETILLLRGEKPEHRMKPMK